MKLHDEELRYSGISPLEINHDYLNGQKYPQGNTNGNGDPVSIEHTQDDHKIDYLKKIEYIEIGDKNVYPINNMSPKKIPGDRERFQSLHLPRCDLAIMVRIPHYLYSNFYRSGNSKAMSATVRGRLNKDIQPLAQGPDDFFLTRPAIICNL